MPMTRYDRPLEFGDVVLVPFPFTSQAASKKRPAVIVSSVHITLSTTLS
jgi:mRNA interferase MazF